MISVEMMSSDTSNGLYMRIVIMKHFFVHFHSVGHVIQLLDTIKKTKQESWKALQDNVRTISEKFENTALFLRFYSPY